MKILIIEDTQELATTLVRYLALKNISSELALTGEDGLYKASIQNYDAIILDIQLPGKSGLEVCRELREKEKNTPIIMLTSRSSKDDIIIGLDAGADDYLTKPFDYDILIARLEALTRRNLKNKSTTIIEIGELKIDLEKIQVFQNNQEIHLSSLEFDLLKCFAQNKGTILSRQDLYEKVWGEFDGDFMFSKTVDVYIGYLRKKLGKEIIQTKVGHGYIML